MTPISTTQLIGFPNGTARTDAIALLENAEVLNLSESEEGFFVEIKFEDENDFLQWVVLAESLGAF